MDEADQAENQAQIHVDAKIAEIRSLSQVSIEGDGTCEVCGVDVQPVDFEGRWIIPRFCSMECHRIADRVQKNG